MKILPSCIKRPGFELLEKYLDEPDRDLRNFQLSESIAKVFDRYVLFRPEMIFRWEEGEENHWQAELWRELIRGNENRHRAGIFREFTKKQSFDNEVLPGRISVFGISALPGFHMEFFSVLSGFTEVNMFFINPCMEFWGDIQTEREMKRVQNTESAKGLSREDLCLERGNSLLSSMGTLGRDFFDLINGYGSIDNQVFESPGEENLLTCIQSDILNLYDRETGEGRKAVQADDDSIRIHSCHSPMREIEVLYDNLLSMFEKDPELKPEEIIVMVPDIGTYASYVQAVFSMPEDGLKKIPFSIADQSAMTGSRVIESFLAILGLAGSRFNASEVLALFDSQAVRRKFGLSADDLNLILTWTVETGIRWGIDGSARSGMDLPGFHENTWKAGLERLLLGYALPGLDKNMFAGILPYDNVEGSNAEVLGKFLDFTQRVFNVKEALSSTQTLTKWSEILTGLLESFFDPGEDAEREIQIIRRELARLADMQNENKAGFDEKLDISVIRHYLGKCFEKDVFGFGFFTKGVTFCAMLPMRIVPFKAVCLVGMNNDVYPRQDIQPGFDFIAKGPRSGDRARRDDDRYLFLESLLSAREKLYISYTGQSIIDNSVIPPSVLVSELIDYIEAGFEIPENKDMGSIITAQRLQGFSPAYFMRPAENPAGKLFSYSRENFETAVRMYGDRKSPEPFIATRLSEPEDEWKTVDVSDLCRFYKNSAQYLVNRRLGFFLEHNYPAVDDVEKFAVEKLDRYLLEEAVLLSRMSGRNPEDHFDLIKASGRLPHGAVGECEYGAMVKRVENFAEKTGRYIKDGPLDPVRVDLKIAGFRLTGIIDSVYPERLLRYRMAVIKPKDILSSWILHLVLNSSAVDGYTGKSMVAGISGKTKKWTAWEFPAVENSREVLEKLLKKYLEGISRPICFFPETSFNYAQLLLEQGKPHEEAVESSVKTWKGSGFNRGECEDPYFQLCCRDADLSGREFADTAIEVYEPILAAREEVED